MNKLNLACLHTLISHLSADDLKTFHQQYLSNFWKIKIENLHITEIVFAQTMDDLIFKISQFALLRRDLIKWKEYYNHCFILAGDCFLCGRWCKNNHEEIKEFTSEQWCIITKNMINYKIIDVKKLSDDNIIY
jgi:hypothetical protein